jgi:hypothetical protein
MYSVYTSSQHNKMLATSNMALQLWCLFTTGLHFNNFNKDTEFCLNHLWYRSQARAIRKCYKEGPSVSNMACNYSPLDRVYSTFNTLCWRGHHWPSDSRHHSLSGMQWGSQQHALCGTNTFHQSLVMETQSPKCWLLHINWHVLSLQT